MQKKAPGQPFRLPTEAEWEYACRACSTGVELPAEQNEADVVVYGGTPSGISAAVASARENKTVVLVVPACEVEGLLGAGFQISEDTPLRACLKETLGGQALALYNEDRSWGKWRMRGNP